MEHLRGFLCFVRTVFIVTKGWFAHSCYRFHWFLFFFFIKGEYKNKQIQFIRSEFAAISFALVCNIHIKIMWDITLLLDRFVLACFLGLCYGTDNRVKCLIWREGDRTRGWKSTEEVCLLQPALFTRSSLQTEALAESRAEPVFYIKQKYPTAWLREASESGWLCLRTPRADG